jgi:hypothetical protein
LAEFLLSGPSICIKKLNSSTKLLAKDKQHDVAVSTTKPSISTNQNERFMSMNRKILALESSIIRKVERKITKVGKMKKIPLVDLLVRI